MFGLDPKGSKYRPLWRRGIWLGKDLSDHDVIAANPETATKTRAVPRTDQSWSTADIMGVIIGPWAKKVPRIRLEMVSREPTWAKKGKEGPKDRLEMVSREPTWAKKVPRID